MSSPRKLIRKAVFPVAGLGTRFLPATKAMPKEMLTVVDRPVIQHVVDEARAAGIEHLIFVTGRNKGVIEDHFDSQYELEQPSRRAARPRSWRICWTICPAPARPASPVSRSRSASAMRCGAPASLSATNHSRCCCPFHECPLNADDKGSSPPAPASARSRLQWRLHASLLIPRPVRCALATLQARQDRTDLRQHTIEKPTQFS